MTNVNIYSDEIVLMAHKLSKMHKSALPIAIRDTLNNAAFDMKGARGNEGEISKSAKKNFITRNKGFFRKFSTVDKAKGFSVDSMSSQVYFTENPHSDAVENLEAQEKGGTIERSVIPREEARTSGSWGRNVQRRFRLSDIKTKKIVDAKNGKGKNKAEKFIRSAIYAGVGNFVIGNFRNSNDYRTMYLIESISKENGKTTPKIKPIFAVKGGHTIKIKSTNFVKEASFKTMKKVPDWFAKAAERRIQSEIKKGRL